jgi:hypothetical protein
MMVGDNFKGALARNSSVAFLIGLAAGLGKMVTLLYEEPHRPMLDVGTLLKSFSAPTQAGGMVKDWVEQKYGQRGVKQVLADSDADRPQQSSTGSQRSARRARRARIRFFGQPDASLDYDLMRYFVATPAYEAAREGDKELLIGRKGVGKSSILMALEAEIGSVLNRLFVRVTPIELEYEQLATVLGRIGDVVHPNFLYPSFWRYVILTEILKQLVSHPLWWDLPGLDQSDKNALSSLAQEFADPLADDFSSRVMKVLGSIGKVAETTEMEKVQARVEETVSRARLYDLERLLQKVSIQLPIFVGIDDIDKRWDPSFSLSSIWLRGLFDELTRLRRSFKGELKSVVMLREDIFSEVKRSDPDFANRSIMPLRWNRDQLADVIAARIVFLTKQDFDNSIEAWNAIFPSLVRSENTADYMIERTLMRPRDLIQYCQLALERSQQSGRDQISEDDVTDAEGAYSQYLFDSVRTEAL